MKIKYIGLQILHFMAYMLPFIVLFIYGYTITQTYNNDITPILDGYKTRKISDSIRIEQLQKVVLEQTKSK